jgi:hypothetical protein
MRRIYPEFALPDETWNLILGIDPVGFDPVTICSMVLDDGFFESWYWESCSARHDEGEH